MTANVPFPLEQVGWVTVPSNGTAGVAGWAFTVRDVELAEVQVPRVAFTVYIPCGAVIVAPERLTPVEGVMVYV